jgi:hypothetical protein
MWTRVLVIGNDDLPEVLDPMLRLYDMTAVHADSVRAAQEIAFASRIDAVVLQAGCSGCLPDLHFLRWIRVWPKFAEIPFIVISGDADLLDHEIAAVDALGARVFKYPRQLSAILDYLHGSLASLTAA